MRATGRTTTERITMKRLIVNADDFGLHQAINRGIIHGHAAGCITSTTVMPGAPAFDDAVELAARHPGLGVGVHLTLVGEKPVAGAAAVPTLVDAAGRFPASYPQFLTRLLQGRVNLAEVRLELTAQVERAVAAGIHITHLDSHQHLHVFPGIIDIVLDIAVSHGIKAIRIPDESMVFTGGYPFTVGRLLGRTGLSSLARLARRKAAKRAVAVPDHFFGMLAGGNMQEQYLQTIIAGLPDGTSEIMIHPGADDAELSLAQGWSYNWQAELSAVTSPAVQRLLAQGGIQIVSFRELEHG